MTYKVTKYVDCDKLKKITCYSIWGIITGLIIFTTIDEYSTYLTQYDGQDGFGFTVPCYKDFLIKNNVTCDQPDLQGYATILSFVLLVGNFIVIWLHINSELELIEFRCKSNLG